MSQVPSQEEFEQIVKNLMSADNISRKQAEHYYDQLRQSNPSWLVQALGTLLSISPDVSLRQMCAVILRRAILKGANESIFPNLPPELQNTTKSLLLQLVSSETEAIVRKSLAFCVASLGSTLCENGQWPELLPFVFTGIRDGHPGLKQSSLSIISSLVTYLSGDQLTPHLTTLRDAFQFALSDQQPIQVRVAAVEAVCTVLCSLEEDTQVKLFSTLTPQLLGTLAATLNQKDKDMPSEVVEYLINVAESTPEVLHPTLADVFAAMLQVAQTESLEDNVRQLAVEFCLSYAESDPVRTKKIPQVIETLLPLSMKWMLNVPEEKDWGTSEEDDDQEITFVDVGNEALDRLALALGGKVIQPVAMPLLAQYFGQPNWQAKHTALMAITQIAEGCSKQLEAHMSSVLQMVLKHTEDPHERVRWAAVHCLSQLCTDFAPGIQLTFHGQIVPAILKLLADPVPRVVAKAAVAVINFMDEAPTEISSPYLDELVTKLLLVLQKSNLRFVNEEVLAAFASIAENSDAFARYYDHIVPYLKTVLGHAPTDKQDRMLRAKAMECITLIGMAVGKEKFAEDAKHVMNVLHQTQQMKLEADDPQAQYVLQAFARIAKCLEGDFAAYLPHVMPILLQQASLQTDVTILDCDGLDDNDDEEEGIETITLAVKGGKDKKIQIKTSLVQDKALAISVMESFLEDIPSIMGPYIEQCSQVLIPLLKFPYASEIRETSAKTLPLMMKALPPHIAKPDMLRHFVVHLLEAIKQEPEVPVASAQVEAFHNCVAPCGRNTMPDEMVAQCSNIMKQVFDESLRRRKDVLDQKKEVADDEDEVEKLDAENEGEEELLNQVTEAVGSLVKTHQSFIPSFMQLFYPLCAQLLEPKYGDVEHRLALCVFDDFVEHGSQINAAAVEPYLQPIISALLKFSSTSDPDVVQASVYGLGVCAQYGANVFRQALPEAIQSLSNITKSPKAKESEYAGALANAVSSLVKVIQYHGNHESGIASHNSLVPLILPHLPVTGDDIEAKYVHEQVIGWVSAGLPVVMGEGNRNLPHILELCKKLVDTEMVNEATNNQIKALLSSHPH